MDEFFNQVYWGNTVLSYLMVVCAIMAVWIILRLVKASLIGLLQKFTSRTNTNLDDLIIKGVEKFVIPYAYLVANYHIIIQLNLPATLSRILAVAITFITFYYAIRLVNFIIHGAVLVYMHQKKEPAHRINQLNGILSVIKAITWAAGIVMLIDNLGYNVTTIIAGLGVGGIAVALAAQNILSDLFSYLVIFFDKPFEVGDFITTNNSSGTVEKIGIKTSHLRSPDGQQMVMPNSEMVKSVIHNYKRLERRRVVFSLGLVYSTTPGQLKKIPSLLGDIIATREQASFDRAHFVSFGDSSLNFEVVYYIDSADFLIYMDTHHSICLSIFEIFEKEKIEFAFPTQTIFINREDNISEQTKTDS
jgi:small-conductance mechanosensitive channel